MLEWEWPAGENHLPRTISGKLKDHSWGLTFSNLSLWAFESIVSACTSRARTGLECWWGSYSPGVGSVQDALSLITDDFLMQIIQHAHPQQHPAQQTMELEFNPASELRILAQGFFWVECKCGSILKRTGLGNEPAPRLSQQIRDLITDCYK